MKNLSRLFKPVVGVKNKITDFAKNSQAVAAVEFALIAPILLILFIGTVEISLAIAVDRKISRTSSAIADLVGQESALDEDRLRAYMGVTDRIMYPYTGRIPCVVISIVEAKAENDTNGDGTIDNDDDVTAKVVKSIDNKVPSSYYTSPATGQCNKSSTGIGVDENARQARVEGSDFTLPASINLHNETFIVAEVEYDHKPVVGFIDQKSTGNIKVDKGAIVLGDRIYLRPRLAISTDSW